MFKKLVANLPFNPSLISQIAFYSGRLKRERAVRGVSVFLILFTMLLQMFAVIVPPQKSLAASDNHILDGLTATRSAQDNIGYLLQTWDSNEDVRSIYATFGVSREDIASMQPKTVTLFPVMLTTGQLVAIRSTVIRMFHSNIKIRRLPSNILGKVPQRRQTTDSSTIVDSKHGISSTKAAITMSPYKELSRKLAKPSGFCMTVAT